MKEGGGPGSPVGGAGWALGHTGLVLQEADTDEQQGTLGFEEFCAFYKMMSTRRDLYLLLLAYSGHKDHLAVGDLQRFLEVEQKVGPAGRAPGSGGGVLRGGVSWRRAPRLPGGAPHDHSTVFSVEPPWEWASPFSLPTCSCSRHGGLAGSTPWAPGRT